ncbi:MAG: hypothetical protein ACI8W8_001949 [Rhodothermales bacterium]|jgi:hypothetical protein
MILAIAIMTGCREKQGGKTIGAWNDQLKSEDAMTGQNAAKSLAEIRPDAKGALSDYSRVPIAAQGARDSIAYQPVVQTKYKQECLEPGAANDF